MFKKYLVIATTAAMIGVTSLVGCGGQASQSTTETAAASQSATTETTDTTTTKAPTSESTSTDTSATTSTDATTTSTTNTATAAEITSDEAMAKALERAGLSKTDVTEPKVERDMDDAIPHYDVEFKHGGLEYDYDIAMDGSILSAHSEYDD